ncbi:cytochrome c oxidase copper chaperone (COX17), putative [Babesia bigemina]|uniref:Cytochrome c oxidase copper chaperone (COX17), putative n=1 Tax=Babesia bigemina TaxID=5866 RepID=A0A061DDF6_BABBI|nr:cytochrome c oxidase copper chaperone (COX17), putative [Babesia bigemina]CDR96235.1 cytochrome c oxidase copper chaperone (COX17), putative [Babesia bigemina]|eukprot:XP_012768421.1 cytochrome c oxidase copper chaperone (COX17), putative [Babesia bigemina]
MGSALSTGSSPCQPAAVAPAFSKSGKHICCVCKETKAARDECIAQKGEDQCRHLIELHNQCLRNEGFDVK